jgi:Cu-Zn family superoxide dismutase
MPPKEAVAVVMPTKGNKVSGVVILTQQGDNIRVRGRVRGLKPGEHGFHIHEYGDVRAPDGTSAGGHYAPHGHKHGGPNSPEHHAGDLGNVTANDNGVAEVDKQIKGMKLHFVIGRSIVVHGGADDLKSQPSGNAGPRVAVGVIGIANPER